MDDMIIIYILKISGMEAQLNCSTVISHSCDQWTIKPKGVCCFQNDRFLNCSCKLSIIWTKLPPKMLVCRGGTAEKNGKQQNRFPYFCQAFCGAVRRSCLSSAPLHWSSSPVSSPRFCGISTSSAEASDSWLRTNAWRTPASSARWR